MSAPSVDSVFTDSGGTWITEDGWTRRERDGQPSYVHCNCCDGPVNRTRQGVCDWCIEAAEIDAEATP